MVKKEKTIEDILEQTNRIISNFNIIEKKPNSIKLDEKIQNKVRDLVAKFTDSYLNLEKEDRIKIKKQIQDYTNLETGDDFTILKGAFEGIKYKAKENIDNNLEYFGFGQVFDEVIEIIAKNGAKYATFNSFVEINGNFAGDFSTFNGITKINKTGARYSIFNGPITQINAFGGGSNSIFNGFTLLNNVNTNSIYNGRTILNSENSGQYSEFNGIVEIDADGNAGNSSKYYEDTIINGDDSGHQSEYFKGVLINGKNSGQDSMYMDMRNVKIYGEGSGKYSDFYLF